MYLCIYNLLWEQNVFNPDINIASVRTRLICMFVKICYDGTIYFYKCTYIFILYNVGKGISHSRMVYRWKNIFSIYGYYTNSEQINKIVIKSRKIPKILLFCILKGRWLIPPSHMVQFGAPSTLQHLGAAVHFLHLR